MSEPRITVTKLHLPRPRLLPVNIRPRECQLPYRYWRWLWLATVVRLLVSIPLAVLLAVPYLLAKVIVWGGDQLGGALGNIPVHAYNRDLGASGWKAPVRRAPALRLSDEWEARLRGRRGDDGEVRGVPAADVPAGDE
jgi:hypothetical protein